MPGLVPGSHAVRMVDAGSSASDAAEADAHAGVDGRDIGRSEGRPSSTGYGPAMTRFIENALGLDGLRPNAVGLVGARVRIRKDAVIGGIGALQAFGMDAEERVERQDPGDQ